MKLLEGCEVNDACQTEALLRHKPTCAPGPSVLKTGQQRIIIKHITEVGNKEIEKHRELHY